MRPATSLWTGGYLLLLSLPGITGVIVELSEIQQVGETNVRGTYDSAQAGIGADLIDTDCPAAGKCIGLLTRDGSLDLDSRYGCTEPPVTSSDDNRAQQNECEVRYTLSTASSDTVTIASVSVALHPDSTRTLTVQVDGDADIEQWEAAPGTTELQPIPGLEGLELSFLTLRGIFGAGDYLGILEVAIYVVVDEVAVVGTSAITRIPISVTATTDTSSAINTLDGDATDSSSWTCASGEACEITYDLQAAESLEQLRIAFSESSDTGGELNIMTAGESGIFSTVRAGFEAGGRPVGSDGLQTFGGIRALARYVKIGVIPPSGGGIVINEVEFLVGDDSPTRPVEEKQWLKPTGPLPLASNYDSDRELNYDIRSAELGGCESPSHFEGCQAYYVKDGDMDSRWSCGRLALGEGDQNRPEDCELGIDLHYFRYVRQIQFAFHMGDEKHDEFSIEALTAQGWVTVVGSAISSGETTGYQTFDVNVHARVINVVPKFQQINQWFSINEIIILERRKNGFIEGTVPVYDLEEEFMEGDNDNTNDEVPEVETPTRFKFDIPNQGDYVGVTVRDATVTALRMRFPADRQFVFQFSTEFGDETFTSAGSDNVWETFTIAEPLAVRDFEIIAVSGPTFTNFPNYPALRVVDFQVVGQPPASPPGCFNMVSTSMTAWNVVPDIIGDGVSDQMEIMTAICETKGATFDGTDCVGELNDSVVNIKLELGEYFLDGPIFVKSGVTLSGMYSSDSSSYTELVLYDGANNENAAEEAIIVIADVTGAEVAKVDLRQKTDWSGDIVPGTVGNLCLDVRNSKDIVFDEFAPRECRTGAAHFTDSSNITTFLFWESSRQETGNYMELTRVDDFAVNSFPVMRGLLMDTCNNIVWEGADDSGLPDPKLSPPAGGDQLASVVITGDSSGIVFKDCDIEPGAEPRIIMESTMPLTLDNIIEIEEAQSGECIVGVPEGTTDDLIVQVNSVQTLSKAGNCWVLD